MMRGLAIAALCLALLLPCGCKQDERAGGDAPMMPPPYQMREAPPPGSRLAVGRDGAALFSNRCGFCHLPGGMGTNLLSVQRVRLGEPPEKGLLTNRDDLSADYVRTVVRQGKVAMPPQTRVDVTDAELDAIAAFLGKGK